MLEYIQGILGKEAKDNSPSPFGAWLNGKLIAAEKGSLTLEFVVRDEQTNPGGLMHGGVAAAIMDEVMGMTLFTLNKETFYVAVNLNVDFLRPGRKGETLTAITEVIRDGRTMTHCECKLYNSENKLI
ncbi:MAG: PaaI family thioesterase, partial [Spirosomaceae bacterium]|nr:PaaI family thioesterase [Spirosomataceae bacterium]